MPPLPAGAGRQSVETVAFEVNLSERSAVSDKIPPRFRKTKSDKWAVMAPVEDLEKALAAGGKIEVQKRSGDWSSFTVGSLGKPFDVDGVQMCYGYAPEPEGDESTGERPPSASSSNGGQNREARRGSEPRRGTRVEAPPVDPSEPLPEFQGGPEDEWDGYF